MASEVSRTFDIPHGAVVVQIADSFGNLSPHTLYLSGVPDVDAAVAQLLTDTEAAAQQLRARLVAAGWTP
jgi:hypothetical protein